MELFKAFAQTNNWMMIWPELSLGLLALLLLAIDIFMPTVRKTLIPMLVMGGQLVIFGLMLGEPSGEGSTAFAGMLQFTELGNVMRFFFLVSSMLVCYIGHIYLSKQILPRAEFYHIVLVSTAALMLLVQSHHFIMLFVALETLTVGLFVLVSYCRKSTASLEAGLKFLILGALSSSLLLFGIVLIYGVSGNAALAGATADGLNFSELTNFVLLNADNNILQIGVALVICGLAFKIGAVPFQIWVPDVYQGAPTPVTAYLAVASKAGGFLVMLNLVTGPFKAMEGLLVPLLSAIAIITILFGNIAALSQSNVKRLMGLSGIAHAGYLLMGVVASFYVDWAVKAMVFYLFTYMLGSFAVFAVMGHMSGDEDEAQQLDDYESFSKEHPFLAGVLAVGLGSLTGVPPLAGFVGKLLIFIAAFQAELYILLAVAIIGVVMSVYYYFGWIRDAFFNTWADENGENSRRKQEVLLTPWNRLVLGFLAGGTLLLGLYQMVF